jgi:hypothetical protein
VTRILLACALLLAALVPASAGGGSRDSGYNVCVPFPCGGGGSYTGPGDVVSGATAWYGLRAYTAAIAAAATQKLINIRNIATSETCDVIVATNGGFGNVANCSGSSSGDTAPVFCAESSSSCAVTEWYDQSGNGNNLLQGTAATQPTLVFSDIGSLPGLRDNGSQGFATTTITSVTAATISGVAQRTGNFTNFNVVLSTFPGSGNAAEWEFPSTTGNIDIYSGARITAAAANSVFHAFQAVPGTSGVINVDGTETTGNSGAAAASTKINVFSNAQVSPSSNLTGDILEAGMWGSTAFSSTQRANMCHNQFTYWGTATSC